MGTVTVRPTTGPDRVFDIDERIYNAFPDDYQLVGSRTSPAATTPGNAATAAPTTAARRIGGIAEEGAH